MQDKKALNWSVDIRPARQWDMLATLTGAALTVGALATLVLSLFSLLQGSYMGLQFSLLFGALLAALLLVVLSGGYLIIFALPGRGRLKLEYSLSADTLTLVQHTRRLRTAHMPLAAIRSVRQLSGGRLRLRSATHEMIVFCPDGIMPGVIESIEHSRG